MGLLIAQIYAALIVSGRRRWYVYPLGLGWLLGSHSRSVDHLIPLVALILHDLSLAFSDVYVS